MKNKTDKTVAHYEALPYTVILRRDEDGDFVAKIQELPGCLAHGANEAGAIESLRSMLRLWIEDALVAGDPIPEPDGDSLPSGKWVQRVPKRLHRDLAQLAARENVSLNQMVTAMIAEAVTARSCAQIAEAQFSKLMESAIPPRLASRSARRPNVGAKPGPQHR